jgi:hypothetical protein
MQNKTEKVEAFADDNTVLALLERIGIETIKKYCPTSRY